MGCSPARPSLVRHRHHLADGRFVLGILAEDRNRIFADAIDIMTAAWAVWKREAPYTLDLEGNRFKVTAEAAISPALGVGLPPKTLQVPRPDIVGTVATCMSAHRIAVSRGGGGLTRMRSDVGRSQSGNQRGSSGARSNTPPAGSSTRPPWRTRSNSGR